MLARVARYEVNQDRLTDAVDAFSEAGREVEKLDGFACSLVDHEDGGTMTVTPGRTTRRWRTASPQPARAEQSGRCRRRIGAVGREVRVLLGTGEQTSASSR
jgi:hypothetical protein